jgi:hypothetical protein
MTAMVERIADEVKALPPRELDEFLAWLADYELAQADDWDREIERDSRPGGRLGPVLKRIQADIAAGQQVTADLAGGYVAAARASRRSM